MPSVERVNIIGAYTEFLVAQLSKAGLKSPVLFSMMLATSFIFSYHCSVSKYSSITIIKCQRWGERMGHFTPFTFGELDLYNPLMNRIIFSFFEMLYSTGNLAQWPELLKFSEPQKL